MNLYQLITESASEVLATQQEDGSFPSGFNGPYDDKETPVRNTSHWLITLVKTYKITGKQLYASAARKALSYLLSSKARPMNGSFWHRKNPKKDFSNGLVGQAWTIEALVEAYKLFKDKEIYKLAEEVFLLHPYNYEVGGWRVVNVDGSWNSLDGTLNHQIWFAASGAQILQVGKRNNKIKNSVIDFINNLNSHLEIYNDGIIKQDSKFLYKGIKKKVIKGLDTIRKSKQEKKYFRLKSAGYHGFNLYGLAILKRILPDQDFWDSNVLKVALDVTRSNKFKEETRNNKYSYPYNPLGFEIALALQEFTTTSEGERANWVSAQLKKCYDFKEKRMSGGATNDPVTSSARLYEACRLKNYQLSLEN